MENLAELRRLIFVDFMGEIKKRIIGYEEEIRQIIICLLAGGPELKTHALLEAVPGVGKTELAKAFAKIIGGKFNRIQGTPDLLPSDIIGVQIWSSQKEEFETKKGPVFTNILLFDEINRATPKTQSALLEAMQEGRVTIGEETYDLPNPFMALATQNPIEHEGTFPLPEAQIDRFMMKIRFDYVSKEDERIVVDRGNEERPEIEKVIGTDKILEMRSLIRKGVKIDSNAKDYIVDLVRATRPMTSSLPEVKETVSIGASPRAEIAIEAASRIHAFLRGGEAVWPDDVDEVALPILRHRIIVNPLVVPEIETIADFVDQLIEKIKDKIGKGYREKSTAFKTPEAA